MIISNRKIWIKLFSILFAASAANAQEEASVASDSSWKDKIGLTGSLRAAYWDQDKQFDPDRSFLSAGAYLSLKPQEFSFGRLSFEGFVQGDNLARDNYSEVDLREGYWSKSFGPVDLLVGRQIIVWGRADKVNPTDSFTQKVYTRLLTDDEEQRLGIFAVQAAYNFENSKLIAIYQPEWREAEIPIDPSLGFQLKSQRPENSHENFGLKYDYSASAFDASVSYYKGHDKAPDAALAGPTTVLLTYNEIETYGLDFATQQGRYGLRGEFAYTDTENPDGSDPTIKNPFFFGVLGVERTFFEYFNINVQVLYKHMDNFREANSFSFPANLLNQQLKINSLQTDEDMIGYSTRMSYKMMNETLELECAFVQWQPTGDYLVRPKITYAVTDHLKVIAGADVFNGNSDTFFGRFEDSTSGFTEVRWYF